MILPKFHPISLTSRVTAFVALTIGLSLLLISHLVKNSIANHFADGDAEELGVIVQAVEDALNHAENNPQIIVKSLSSAVSGHHGVYFQVHKNDGTLIYQSPGADLTNLVKTSLITHEFNTDNLIVWQARKKTYRGGLTQRTIGSMEYQIATAIDMEHHLLFLENFTRSLWLIMSMAGILTLMAAWLGVLQGHAPLRSMIESMSDIQTNRLHIRLDPEAVPLEIKALVISFNHMIERLEDGFSRLSHFSADIAHELRTPLTNIITQTQVGLSQARTREEYRELLYSNLEEQERLAKMVSDMLWLAKSDHGQIKPVTAPINLTEEIQELFDFFSALAEDNGVKLRMQGEPISISGDRTLLRRALTNLLSNAIRHTSKGQAVIVELSKNSVGEVSIAVENQGNDIPQLHLMHLFDRFYRVDPSRQRHSEGAGLGLAITKSIIEAHGGQISAKSGNGLTCFSISLPTNLNGKC